MRKVLLCAATALAFASPALAADYSERSIYEREVHTTEHRTRPVVVEHRPVVVEHRPIVVEHRPVVVEQPAPVVVPRPVVVERAPVVVEEEYPVYAAPRVYAYAGPGWRGGWGYRRHFHGGW